MNNIVEYNLLVNALQAIITSEVANQTRSLTERLAALEARDTLTPEKLEEILEARFEQHTSEEDHLSESEVLDRVEEQVRDALRKERESEVDKDIVEQMIEDALDRHCRDYDHDDYDNGLSNAMDEDKVIEILDEKLGRLRITTEE